MSFLGSTFSVSETHFDLDLFEIDTVIVLLISLRGHWIQEIAKFNIHAKPLIKAVSTIQSLWFCFLSITDILLSLVPNHEWHDIFQKIVFFVSLNLED